MARSFDDASTQYLLNATGLGFSSYPVSMAAWVYQHNSIAGYAIGVNNDGVDSKYLGLRSASADDTVRARAQSVSAQAAEAISTSSFGFNVWHHWGGVFVNSTSRAVYLDGGSKGTNSGSVAFPDGLNATAIGVQKRLSLSGYMDGEIAVVGVWSATLTDAEMVILAAGFSPLSVRPQSLVAYWPLIGRTSPEIDTVGGYNMTLVNAPTVAAHPRIYYPLPLQNTIVAGADVSYTSPFPAFRRQ